MTALRVKALEVKALEARLDALAHEGDEPAVDLWRQAVEPVGAGDSVEARLRRLLPQLAFPIAPGMRRDRRYVDAVLRGVAPPGGARGASFERPESLELWVDETAVGAVPIVHTPHRPDFETLLRCLAGGNEPIEVSPRQGACLLTGLRLPAAAHDRSQRPRSASESPRTRLIVLTDGPYAGLEASAVAAVNGGLGDAEWLDASRTIRRAHEVAHFIAWRILEIRPHRLHDEVIADWAGLLAAFGHYDPALARTILGVTEHGRAVDGGRVELYRSTDPALRQAPDQTLERAAETIDRLARQPIPSTARELARTVGHLTQKIPTCLKPT